MYLPVFAAQKQDSKSNDECEFAHQQVYGFIRQWVDDNVYNHIANETNARNLWEKMSPWLLDQLLGMGIKCDDEILGLWLLNTLPESWEIFRVSITNSAPDGIVSLQMAKSAALNEEMRRKAHGSSSQSENRDKKSKQKGNDQADGDRVTAAICNDDLIIFHDYDSKMGNDDESKVIGVGDVCLQTNMGMKLLLRGVKHAPDVCFNLIFVQLLDNSGYDNHFGFGKWQLTKRTTIQEFLNEGKCIYDSLLSMGKKLSEVDLMGYILDSLPKEYMEFISSHNHSPSNSFKDFIDELLQEETLMSKFSSLSLAPSKVYASHTRSGNKSHSRGNSHSKGNHKSNCGKKNTGHSNFPFQRKGGQSNMPPLLPTPVPREANNCFTSSANNPLNGHHMPRVKSMITSSIARANPATRAHTLDPEPASGYRNDLGLVFHGKKNEERVEYHKDMAGLKAIYAFRTSGLQFFACTIFIWYETIGNLRKDELLLLWAITRPRPVNLNIVMPFLFHWHFHTSGNTDKIFFGGLITLNVMALRYDFTRHEPLEQPSYSSLFLTYLLYGKKIKKETIRGEEVNFLLFHYKKKSSFFEQRVVVEEEVEDDAEIEVAKEQAADDYEHDDYVAEEEQADDQIADATTNDIPYDDEMEPPIESSCQGAIGQY
ncbi:Retrovirus-related Pol polyprotein from transposon TNT 1-94-like protein [Drosera capensis]